MDRRRSVLENALQPLVSGLVEVSPSLWKHTKRIGKYWLMLPFDCSKILFDIATGRYEYVTDEKELSLKDQLEINNIVKYEYYPLDELERSSVNQNLVKYEYIEGEKKGVRACVGCNMEGEPKWFDILEGHTLVGGMSEWGKGGFLNAFITSILLSYTPNEVAFMGCDFIKKDIYYFRRYKHFINDIATNKNEFLKHMDKLETIMNQRAKIIDEYNCRSVKNYNSRYDKKMTYIIYVLDELPQVTHDKECSDKLKLIMQKCRSYGIYFILATQDATKDTIGKCKMNCSQTVGFRTRDTTDSKTLINNEILETIRVRGRCFIDNSEGMEETQIFYVSEEQMEDLLKDKLKEKYKQLQEQEG